MRNRNARGLMAGLAVAISVASAGCGYSFRAPYNRSIRTVYLPMMKSTRFHRDLNLQLTDMVKNEILTRTSYKVVGSPEGADVTLLGIISFDDKSLMLVNPDNLPRQLQSTMYATVSYTDNRTNTTIDRKIPASLAVENAQFFPELGETASLGFQKAMQRLARDIVNMMEDPWGEEYRDDADAPPKEADADDKPARKPRTSLLR